MLPLRSIILSAIIITASVLLAQAQWRPVSPAIPSANATSLGLYNELPVSYFTGVPNISVPVYQIKGSRIGMPIELSYHAAGLRPEVHPGWVGNGWSLQVGGIITRKVNGSTDESYRPDNTGKVGYYFLGNYLNKNSWYSDATANDALLYPPIDAQKAIEDGDTEPDEFNFSFLGYSGKFFLDQAGAWQVQCDKHLKVVFDPTDFIYPFIYYKGGTKLSGNRNTVKTFGKFTIYDEVGNQYIFGCLNPAADQTNSAIEYSDALLPRGLGFPSSLYATSWYLSQINSADRSETITLTYERGPITSTIGWSYAASQSNGTIPSAGWFNKDLPCMRTSPGNGGLSGSLTFPVYLAKITMPSQDLEITFTKSASNELNYPLDQDAKYADGSGRLNVYNKIFEDSKVNVSSSLTEFPSPYLQYLDKADLIPYFAAHPAPQPGPLGYANRLIWLKLDAISIRNSSSDAVLRTVSFNYNNNSARRLQLNQIFFADQNGAPVQRYVFAYNNATLLPNYLETLTDHWGFNNNNKTALQILPNNFDQIRAPDPTGAQTKAEILTSITYPTGGTTTFEYEPNSYSSAIDRSSSVLPFPESGIAGGLRIKKITSIDNNGNSLTKNYFYVNGDPTKTTFDKMPSSGVLDSKPAYVINIKGTDVSNYPFTFTSISSNSVIPLTANSSGTHIGYSQVIEQLSDKSYSIYQFTNHDNGYPDDAPLSKWNPNSLNYYQSSSLAFERGKLAHRTDYSTDGKMVKDEMINYAKDGVVYYSGTSTDRAANAVQSSILYLCSQAAVAAVSRTAYQLYYHPFVPVSRTEKLYSSAANGKGTTSEIKSTFDQYNNLVNEDILISTGQVLRTRYKYAYQYANGRKDNAYDALLAVNRTREFVEKITSKVNPQGEEYITGGELHTYQQYNINKVFNDGIFVWESASPVPFASFTQSGYKGVQSNGQVLMDRHYVQRAALYYDDQGNLSTIKEDGSKTTAYLWDYNKAKLVAKVKRAVNTYGNTPAEDATFTEKFNVHLYGTLDSPIETTFTVSKKGPVSISFLYAGPPLSGTNSTQIEYVLISPGNTRGGTLCNTAPGSTGSCGTYPASITIPDVAPGTCTLRLTVRNMIGFQNYYGFDATVSYPKNPYTAATGKTEIAYTSFEYTNASALNYGTGNWTGINLNSIVKGNTALTGSRYYTLSAPGLTSSTLDPAASYELSYWSKNGQYTVSGSQSVMIGKTLPSGWTYYRHIVTGVSSVNLTGSGSLDELRLYPLGSEMITFSYEPLVGLKSTVDDRQQVSTYNYDTYQRLETISDQNGDIRKFYSYNYTAGSAKPFVLKVYPSGPLTIAADFVPVANCNATTIAYTDLTTGQTGSNTGGCYGTLSVSVPNSGHTYRIVISSITKDGTLSALPIDVTIP